MKTFLKDQFLDGDAESSSENDKAVAKPEEKKEYKGID